MPSPAAPAQPCLALSECAAQWLSPALVCRHQRARTYSRIVGPAQSTRCRRSCGSAGMLVSARALSSASSASKGWPTGARVDAKTAADVHAAARSRHSAESARERARRPAATAPGDRLSTLSMAQRSTSRSGSPGCSAAAQATPENLDIACNATPSCALLPHLQP
jgi:hypothetical protein